MKKILYLIFLFFIVTNCKLKPIEKYHGVSNLDLKQKKLIINKTNKNEIINILGAPSTKSLVSNNYWIYIENKKTKSSIFKLGKTKVEKNNVLLLEIDRYGVLKFKKFYNIEDQNKILFTNKTTKMSEKDSFVFSIVSSLRQKIDSPKRNRNKK